MAFCMSCGAQLAEGTAFCSNCGAPVQMQAAPGAVQQAAEEVSEQVQQTADSFGEAATSFGEETQQAAMSFGEQAQGPAMSFGSEPQAPAMSFGAQEPQPAMQMQQDFGTAPSMQMQQDFGGQPSMQQPAMQLQQDPMQQQAWQQGQAYAQGGGGFAQPEQKSKKGLVIGLAVGGVVLVAAIVLLVLFLTGVIGGGGGANKFVGEWKFEKMSMMGLEITKDTISAFGMGDMDMKVVISEDGTVKMDVFDESETFQGTFSEDGKKLTISQYGESIEFVIEGGDLVFAMEQDGFEAKMVFTK